MAKAAATKSNHSLILRLLILLSCGYTKLLADAHSLSCNLIIKTGEYLWYVGQCSVDGISFPHFNNINKTVPLGNLGKMANATEVQSCLTQHLNDLSQELRIKVETLKTRGYSTLQATMVSELSQGQITMASWLFNIDEKYFFSLETNTMTWKWTNFVPEDIMNKWKDDEELNKSLKFSIAECSQKLNEFLKEHKEKPRSTSRSLDITQLTTPTQLQPTIHFPYTEVFIPGGLIVIFFIICIYVMWKCIQGDKEQAEVSFGPW